jgi:hypothetical protein
MEFQLFLVLFVIGISIYFFFKHRNIFTGIIFFTLIVSVFLSLLNIGTVSRMFYWASLVFLIFYPFIAEKKNKILIILYTLPFLIDEIFRTQHYPNYLIKDVLFLLPFLLYIIMVMRYKEYKNEFSVLTLTIGLNLITLLKTFQFL